MRAWTNLLASTIAAVGHRGKRRQLRLTIQPCQCLKANYSSITSTTTTTTTLTMVPVDDANGSGNQARVFWEGPLFGRLTRQGKAYLLERGWQRIHQSKNDNNDIKDDQSFWESATSTSKRLALAWPSKTGPQFEINDNSQTTPCIRPYPTHSTGFVDDKLGLAQLLDGSLLIPRHFNIPPSLEDSSSLSDNDSSQYYFVKHRYGAQGKSVSVYDHQGLMDWYARSRNPQDFVIQEEVLPSLFQGRKFVLRSHILVVQRSSNSDRSKTHTSPTTTTQQLLVDNPSSSCLESYLSKRVICQHHASSYDGFKQSGCKSSQISQAGTKHPRPVLLEELSSDHPACGAFDLVEECSKELVQAMAKRLVSTTSENGTILGEDATCFALLGTDLLLDASGNIKICEVNSHPALGWGTMSQVPTQVFAELVQDTLSILIDGFGEHQEHGSFRNMA